MFAGFWFSFFILLLAAILGSITILPYSIRLLKESPKNKLLTLPFRVLILLSVLQNTILSAIVIGIGLIAAHQIGLGVPIISSVNTSMELNLTVTLLFLPALALGIIGGCLLLFADMLFFPHLPEKLRDIALRTTQWENFTASFYGGINEELIMRLFGVSVIVWMLSKSWHTSSSLPVPAVFWVAIICMAVIFALGHLPTLKNVVGEISPILFFRTMLLNTPIGLLCGWIFWHYGIEAAILTHFAADIVYHVGGTFMLQWKLKR